MKAFFRFWYDFVVGDDWSIAAAVVAALAITAVLAHHGWRSLWWLMPLVVVSALTWSVLRASKP
jgi:hypothetical protein